MSPSQPIYSGAAIFRERSTCQTLTREKESPPHARPGGSTRRAHCRDCPIHRHQRPFKVLFHLQTFLAFAQQPRTHVEPLCFHKLLKSRLTQTVSKTSQDPPTLSYPTWLGAGHIHRERKSIQNDAEIHILQFTPTPNHSLIEVHERRRFLLHYRMPGDATFRAL